MKIAKNKKLTKEDRGLILAMRAVKNSKIVSKESVLKKLRS